MKRKELNSDQKVEEIGKILRMGLPLPAAVLLIANLVTSLAFGVVFILDDALGSHIGDVMQCIT